MGCCLPSTVRSTSERSGCGWPGTSLVRVRVRVRVRVGVGVGVRVRVRVRSRVSLA